MNKQGKVIKEIIKPYIDRPLDIIKKTDEEGNVTYWDPRGSEINTYSQKLYDIFWEFLCRFEGLVNLLDVNAWADFGCVFYALKRDGQ